MEESRAQGFDGVFDAEGVGLAEGVFLFLGDDGIDFVVGLFFVPGGGAGVLEVEGEGEEGEEEGGGGLSW